MRTSVDMWIYLYIDYRMYYMVPRNRGTVFHDHGIVILVIPWYDTVILLYTTINLRKLQRGKFPRKYLSLSLSLRPTYPLVAPTASHPSREQEQDRGKAVSSIKHGT